MSATLSDCIAEWLRTTQRTNWEVFDDKRDVWLQLAPTSDIQNIPHYMINVVASTVIPCCPETIDDEWVLDARDPKFFDILKTKMDQDEAKLCKTQ